MADAQTANMSDERICDQLKMRGWTFLDKCGNEYCVLCREWNTNHSTTRHAALCGQCITMSANTVLDCLHKNVAGLILEDFMPNDWELLQALKKKRPSVPNNTSWSLLQDPVITVPEASAAQDLPEDPPEDPRARPWRVRLHKCRMKSRDCSVRLRR